MRTHGSQWISHKINIRRAPLQKTAILNHSSFLGAIFILRKDIGVGGPGIGNFLLLYVVKMSLCVGGGWFKKASKHPYIT